MSMQDKKTHRNSLSLGISPCPNDTFIFHALLSGLVDVEYAQKPYIVHQFADVEKLNKMALAGELEITKISIGVIPKILDKYSILASGAALGWGCGPLVVARKNLDADEAKNAKVAIPGRLTTARMLLDLHGGFKGEKVEMVFNEIMPAVAAGKVDAGVIIHEGRFTYPQYNLHKILDLGEWWEASWHVPLPLGAIAVRRDVPYDLAKAMEKAISRSVRQGFKNPAASKDFIRAHAQEMDEEITGKHIKTFVTDFSEDLGKTGRQAIKILLENSLSQVELDNIFLKA